MFATYRAFAATLAISSMFLIETVALGATCKIDGRCNNANYPFRVVDSSTGQNITGECSVDFDGALRTFISLEETGQCSVSLQAPECVIDGKCSNTTNPFRVVLSENSENLTGFCESSVQETMQILRGLRYTGQCSQTIQGKPCGVDARCKNSNYKYRVFYSESQSNVLGQCHSTFEEAVQTFRFLKEVGQCTSN